MKALDVKSSLVAGIAGAILLYLVIMVADKIVNSDAFESYSPTTWLLAGFLVGAGVQTVERFSGAS